MALHWDSSDDGDFHYSRACAGPCILTVVKQRSESWYVAEVQYFEQVTEWQEVFDDRESAMRAAERYVVNSLLDMLADIEPKAAYVACRVIYDKDSAPC